eukprot:gene9790-1987_t
MRCVVRCAVAGAVAVVVVVLTAVLLLVLLPTPRGYYRSQKSVLKPCEYRQREEDDVLSLHPLRSVGACTSVRNFHAARNSSNLQSAKLMFVGDISFARDVGQQLSTYPSDESCSSIFQHVSPVFQLGDLVVANLESPGVNDESTFDVATKRISLRSNITHLQCLVDAGIDVVSLANNHMLDFGEDSFRDTVNKLRDLKVSIVGASVGNTHLESQSGILIRKVNGVSIGFVAFCQLSSCKQARSHATIGPRIISSIEDLRNAISKASSEVHVIVILMHWAREYYTTVSDYQRYLAQEMLLSGAHIIIGSHQHVLQDHSLTAEGVVLYGLGNFVFDSHVCRDPKTYEIRHNASLACLTLPNSMRGYVSKDVFNSRIYSVTINKLGVLGAAYIPVRTIHRNANRTDNHFPVTFRPTPVGQWKNVCQNGDVHCLQCS